MNMYVVLSIVAVFTLAVGVAVGYSIALNKYRSKPVGSLLIVENEVDGTQMILEIPDKETFELVKLRRRITLDVIRKRTK